MRVVLGCATSSASFLGGGFRAQLQVWSDVVVIVPLGIEY